MPRLLLALLAVAAILACAGARRDDAPVRTEIVELAYLPAEHAATVIVERLDSRAPRVLPDVRANVLLVLGTEAEIDCVRDLVRELDRPSN